MYHNNKIIFKLHFLINLILPKSIVHINSCPKDICICKKIRITRTIIPYFISFFFHERSIHALYFFEYLVQRVSTGTLFSGGNERRDNVTRLAHHHDLDTNATWQTGYIFPLMNESCTRERRRATLPAAFSAMYRESSTWVANIARVCLWRKQVSNRFSSSVTGITLYAMEWSFKALLYSIIRETVVIRQKSECKLSNKVFQWIFSGDSNRRDIENGIVYFGWEWRGGGCFFASRFKIRHYILSIVQDIGERSVNSEYYIGEDWKKR